MQLRVPRLTQSSDRLLFPTMGCGTWAWGNRFLWGYREEMDEQLQAVFEQCVRQGVTLFDTGDSYGTGRLNGRSEQLLGRFAQAYKGPNLARIIIATKLAAYPWRLSRRSMVKAGQASAERLGRPIDLVQMHWSPANYAPWQEGPLLEGLADLYEQGLVKGVGLSNYGPQSLRKAYQRFAERGVPVATLQVQYSLLSTYPVTSLSVKEICDELGIRLIAYSPLALGILTGKYAEQGPFPKGIRGQLIKQLLPGARPLLQVLQSIAQGNRKTMAQVALNWCMAKGTIPIPGAKTLEQAQQNMGAMGWRLSKDAIAQLDEAAALVHKKMVQNIFQTR
ncbi:MAG: aldo/keto reductase [Thermosynechococcaceae cyanobacterium]